MIVGTAGHVDHGKTTLVRALTGVDTDRLPEEKRRGISIELGYAFLDAPGLGHAGRIAFVDVPGHERLVHTMLAGATGIDFGLLVVAADDGVMPQTREHLAVLSLLGLSRAAVVVTKTDLVDHARIEQVRAEIHAMLAGTPLAGAPLLTACAHRGDGFQALRGLLFEAAGSMPPRTTADEGFRLAIDRVFTLAGTGTVATGTVHAGSVAIGDDLEWTPAETRRHARVRSLHAQNRAVERASVGQRCAIALAGVSVDAFRRGQWLVGAGGGVATDRLDALIEVWPAETDALKSGTQVHVHIGAGDTLGSVAILKTLDRPPGAAPPVNADAVPPGGRAYVQVVLRQPIGAWHGDRIVLRDNAASRTLAGGRVLDPFAPARYRGTPQRLGELDAWSIADRTGRLAGLVAAASQGVDLRRWCRAEGVASPGAATLAQAGMRVDAGSRGEWLLGDSQRTIVEDRLVDALQSFHAREPETLGPDAARLHRLAAPRLPDPVWRDLLSSLRDRGMVAARGSFVYLPAHRSRLHESDRRLHEKLAPTLAACGLDGLWARDLARDACEHEPRVRALLCAMARRGELHQIVKDLFYPPGTVGRLAAIVRGLSAGADGVITAARFRDASGLGRKRAIQLLEYFDRVGLLRRVGDEHRLRGEGAVFFDATP